jgi:uncharacterized protein
MDRVLNPVLLRFETENFMSVLLMFALVAFLIGLSKGGLGGPVPISLTAPLLSLVIPVSEAIGTVLPLLIFADLFALYFYWRDWDMHYVRMMLPAAVVGIVIGTLLLATLDDTMLRRVIGAFTLIAVIYKVTSSRLKQFKYTPRQWHGVFAGWASGLGSSLANAGSPPFVAYMLMQPNVTPITFVGTTTLFFAIVNALKLPGFILAGTLNAPLLISVVFVLPIIPLGVWVGRVAVKRMNPQFFENLLLGSLFLLSLWLLLR